MNSPLPFCCGHLISTFKALAILLLVRLSVEAAQVDIQVRGESVDDDFLTWAAAIARIRLQPGGANQDTVVALRNANAREGGQLVFGERTTGAPTATKDTLTLTLPRNGNWVEFNVAGKFPFASFGKKDAIIQAVNEPGGATELGRLAVMVRVRKNANDLSELERKQFLNALNTFRQITNVSGQNFGLFHTIHTGDGYWQAHVQNAFLPWHRAFLLHFERRLQQIDPLVALPYWRFDKPADKVFSPDFVGAPSNTSFNAILARTNPIFGWTIRRRPAFAPNQAPADILSQAGTLALGGRRNEFASFTQMEVDPHGSAHGEAAGPRSNGSWIGNPTTAAQDPLFFLLHCNADRLWARWQLINGRFGDDELAYSPRGTFSAAPVPKAHRIGAYSLEKFWPWGGQVDQNPDVRRQDDYPPTAPGGQLPQVTGLAPKPAPTAEEMLDYLGLQKPEHQLGFCYDDIGLTNFADND
jgi:tyrosinase